MKRKSLIMIFSIILICMPTQIFAWTENTTYEACNIINSGISWLLKTMTFIIVISYMTGVIQYIKNSQIERKQKIKNIITWLIILIVEVSFLLSSALWVTQIGMETYWSTGERVQLSAGNGCITYYTRIFALILIIIYIITAIIYIAKSKQEKLRKAENVIRWQIITSAIVAGILIYARNL